jgi:hypothetical protein
MTNKVLSGHVDGTFGGDKNEGHYYGEEVILKNAFHYPSVNQSKSSEERRNYSYVAEFTVGTPVTITTTNACNQKTFKFTTDNAMFLGMFNTDTHSSDVSTQGQVHPSTNPKVTSVNIEKEGSLFFVNTIIFWRKQTKIYEPEI